MRVRVRKWGNSLALRIPKAFAAEAAVGDDAVVDLTVVDGSIVATPVARDPATLKDLLAEVTDDNIHGEEDFGPPAGREVW